MNLAALNHSYRLVWSDAHGALVAVPENAKGRGKSGRSRSPLSAIALIATSALLACTSAPLGAQTLPATLPTGANVVSGQASVSTSGTTMTVTQSSDRMAADWQSFNIGQGHTVNFVQPSASSVALNRVLGADVSLIQGALNANGQVFLLNPNGVLFTPTAQVNVGGMVASTLQLSTADFMAGNYRFEGDSAKAIVNQGRITALGDGTANQGGTIALIAAKIINTGSLTANQGQVLVGAGSKVTLDMGGPVKLQVEQGALEALIEQGGAIRADGGAVYLTAKAAGSLASSVINHSGVTQAKSLSTNARGEIVLESSHAIVHTGTLDVSGVSGVSGGQISLNTHNLIDAGTTLANSEGQGGNIHIQASGRVLQTTSATLQANGANSGAGSGGSGSGGTIRIQAGESAWLSGSLSVTGQSGGDVSLTAPELTLTEARIDASGRNAGGRIRVGGGWQGKDTDIANAQRTRVVASAFNVSATERGNGGTAVVWSDAETMFGGHIAAKGGASGGNGGQVEVSSHDTLRFGGLVDASAPKGNQGRLLLDPKNITVVDAVSGFDVLTLTDPTPSAGEAFGTSGRVVELTNNGVSTNRIVVASALDDAVATDAGAVYVYNSQTGALISTLTGSTANDQVGSGGVTALTNGNFVVSSANWNNAAATSAGAVTWGSGSAGISGVVSATNSLVGSTTNDQVGSGGVTALTNGNYVVRSSLWDNGPTANAGAATWGNGSTGISGEVSAANSLVGSAVDDQVSSSGVTALTNGNYVVRSPLFNNLGVTDTGAATWGNGETGINGVVSVSNSLVGGHLDTVGSDAVVALTNGNYVVIIATWDRPGFINAGAVTWGNGSTGINGAVAVANSLVGGTTNDQVGSGGIKALTNGNYVVNSPIWDSGSLSNVGAVTWGNGSTGITGAVSAANSLVGSKASDTVGIGGVTALTNGNYVVSSRLWDNGAIIDVGAVTWGNGNTGISGTISSSNSLVGSTSGDLVGSSGITALTNGNYVVGSKDWWNGTISLAGAVTWGNGGTGISGAVSASNSLVGITTNDRLSSAGVTALTNGNYVVNSPNWVFGTNANAGAVTWGNGSVGLIGNVSVANSLIGQRLNDQVGGNGTKALSNGNYVATSTNWANGGSRPQAGAVTWGNGSTGTTGVVSVSNSLVGSAANDRVGSGGVTPLNNGNYVVSSRLWDNGSTVDAGAVSWGNGSTGVSGTVSSANSVVGSTANDQLGNGQVIALADGRSLVGSPNWTNGAAASAGRIDILSAPSSLPLGYSTSPAVSSTVSANTLLANLNAGTAVTLQANNDITLSTALAVNNPSGNGGALTLQAGRSILLNANISTDNGNLSLIANDRAANGVVDAYRDPGAANITQAVGTTINAGTGTVSIDLRDGAGNTNNTVGTVTLASINAASLSVQSSGFNASATAENKTYDGAVAATLSAASLSGLTLQSGSNLSVVNPSAGSFATTSVGTTKPVTSDAFKITGYNASQSSDVLKVGASLTASTAADINQRPISVSADTKTKVYGNTDPALTYTVTSGNLVGSDSLGALTRTDGENAGTYTINAGALSNGNYLITATDGTLTINQRPISVSADAKTKVYGNTDPALTYTVTSGNLVGNDSLGGELTRTAGENAGTYTINAGGLSNGNYLITATDGTLTINQRPITVAADAKTKVYGNTDPALTYTVTSGNLVGSDSLGALTRTAGENAGTYTINAGALSNGNYLITAIDGTLTITAAPVANIESPAQQAAIQFVQNNASKPLQTDTLLTNALLVNDEMQGNTMRSGGLVFVDLPAKEMPAKNNLREPSDFIRVSVQGPGINLPTHLVNIPAPEAGNASLP